MVASAEITFELKPLRKYTVECPECGSYRDKRRTKTLTVYRDPPNEKNISYIRWQCSHSGQCSLNARQWALDPSPEDVDHTMDTTSTPTPLRPIGELPTTHEGNALWWYRNSEGEPLYAVMRKDTGNGKSYHPVTLDGDRTVQLPGWPAAKVFYGGEHLQHNSTVLVVEGEKACDAARRIFPSVAAITWRGGAANPGTAPWESLVDKKIYLWSDNDTAGHKVMADLLDRIPMTNEIYMVDTTVFPPKSDLADNLDRNLINKAIKEAKLIKKPEASFVSLDDIAEQEERLGPRFKVGWPEIDAKLSFPATGVVVLEGRTGHAKTGTAINIASNALRSGTTVHYFSYEIPASRVYARFLRLHEVGEIDVSVADWIDNKNLCIYDQAKQLPLKKLKELLDNPKLGRSLVIIDYAQIVPCSSIEQRNKMIELMDSLRILANTHGFLVLLLSQLTPDYSNPLYDAPRDAKDIHFSAEMVLRVWNKDNEFNHILYDEVPGNLIMHVIKNRDGESGHLLGFAWAEGVYMEPNGHISKAGKHKAPENKSALALEKIATILQAQYGGF